MRTRPFPSSLLAVVLGAGLLAAALPGVSQTGVSRPTSRVWTAGWIWTTGPASPRNSYVCFRRTVELRDVPRQASIHLTADSRYILWVNGEYVGRGPVRSDRRWLYYDTWDVTSRLRRGPNSIAVLVHHYGEFTFSYMHGRGGLVAELVTDSGRLLAGTDSRWKAWRHPGWATGQPRMSIQLGFNEIFDARTDPLRWREPGFDDSAWPAAVEIGPVGMEPWPNLVARDIPPMLETPRPAVKVLETAQVEDPPPAQHVDLLPLMEPKQDASAYLAVRLESPDAREVELKFGSDDALKVWLNGREILSRLVDRGAAPDQETVRASLRPGSNLLLAKVVQGHTRWEFFFRIGAGGEGVRQLSPLPGAAEGERRWAVIGPFPHPAEGGIRRGFETRYPPEESADFAARYRNAAGREVAWRAVQARSTTAVHIAEAMTRGVRSPARAVRVEGADRLIQSGASGAVVRTAPGIRASFLIDFGQEVTGFPRFRVRGARGGEVIDMGYGEVLHDEKGGFLPQSSGKIGRLNPNRDNVHYADRYLCRPGNQTFQTFDKRAFRYLQLDVREAPEGIEIDDVGIVFSTYPVEYRGAFQCSDERLNRIWEIGRWTCQLNMEDGYTDCPWRERGQWWGDARVEALINYYCFGDVKLMRKALRQKGQSLNDEGMTWGVYPTDWDGGRLPSFTLIWISCIWETYLYTGDAEIVRELYPKARKSLDTFFAPRVGPRGLLKDVPYWVFIDWAPVDDKGEPGALNAYYYDALRAAAAMGRLLNDPSGAEYERRAEAVKAAMNRHLWDPAQRVYRDSIQPDGKLATKISQQTNSLCVLFDIAPREEHQRILDFLYDPANLSAPGKIVQAGSPYFSYYQLAALYHAGRDLQALQYIREKWGVMLDWGATTWWEMWQPGASFCHGWSGGPTYNLPAEVLGVQPLKPGFAEVEVAPQWVGLRYATGVIPTVKGRVEVAWQRDEGGKTAAVRVRTEEGVPFELELPGKGEVRVDRRNRLPAGVRQVESRPGTSRYRVEKGGQVLFELREG